MISQFLKERNLPALLPREAMLDILQREEYGYLPEKPTRIAWDVEENIVPNFCAGKAMLNKVTATMHWNDGKQFSFPFYTAIPTAPGQYPFFIHINFRPDVPDRYMPTEELIDRGFAVLSFCYNDITKDNDDFEDGLSGVLFPGGKRNPQDAGKIALWAFAAQRVMDYAQTQSHVLDLSCGIVCGHSRLGKTALLTAATDTRFAYCYSNDSGCSGAAISRGKTGETVETICCVFPYWFCDNYRKYADKEDEMPFDQHYLLASIAPRKVLVGSAEQDLWADPLSEMLACVAASPAFSRGFLHSNRPPQAGDLFIEGDIGYHMRAGMHYFSRLDWNQLIAFILRTK